MITLLFSQSFAVRVQLLSTRLVLHLSASVLRASVQVRACPVRTLGLERKDQHKCTQVRARVAIHAPALPVT